MITNNKLDIFGVDGIVLYDKTLPKYKTIVNTFNNNKKDSSNSFNYDPFSNVTPDNIDMPENIISFDLDADLLNNTSFNAKDFNIKISSFFVEHMMNAFFMSPSSFVNNRIDSSSLVTVSSNSLNNRNNKNVSKNKIIKRFKTFFHKSKKKNDDEEYSIINILDFFKNIKIAVKNKEKFINRIREYINVIKLADESGQDALKEKLLMNLIINKYESILYANDLYKAITEEQVIEFAKKCPKGLDLTFIKNYVGVIPVEIIKQKIEIDKLEIFDNYVILHYDPSKKNYSLTLEEKEKEERIKKDPILFGLISGSRKLYFINDWIDEYCNLTFDKIVDTLGKEKIEKSYITKNINY